MGSMAGLRTRWAAIGAACAVALGAGGLGMVSATTSSGDRAIYVPVTPIRVLDTRSGDKVVNETIRLVIEGIITTTDGVSQQVVPTDASAVAINITATSTLKNGNYGYVTVFPCTSDVDVAPNASSLNFENGVDIANALNVTTSANGSICLYVYGTADLLVDIAGYYADHNHDDRYYTKEEIDDALAGKANTADVDTSLNGVTSALADKANSNEVEAALSRKVSIGCAEGGICSLGETGPGGGVVFYDAGTEQTWGRYLEVACAGWQSDCDGSTADPGAEGWGCSGQDITGADGTGLGTGRQNTSDIVAECEASGYAAKLADQYSNSGETDWYLPSRDELNALCKWAHDDSVNVACNENGGGQYAPLIRGGFSLRYYWTSTEVDAGHAEIQGMATGFLFGLGNVKDTQYRVRPIRAF